MMTLRYWAEEGCFSLHSDLFPLTGLDNLQSLISDVVKVVVEVVVVVPVMEIN